MKTETLKKMHLTGTIDLAEKIQIIEKEEIKLIVSGPAILPIEIKGKVYMFQWYTWLRLPNHLRDLKKEEFLGNLKILDSTIQYSSLLIFGDFAHSPSAVIRFHSICHTGDIFRSQKCDCGSQLNSSLEKMVDYSCGALFYLANQEGRGIGLFNKNLAYILQEKGFDTVEANHHLGFNDDSRTYEEAILLLKHFREKPVDMMTNNPNKIDSLINNGVKINNTIPIWSNSNEYNENYLETKRLKNGHIK